MKIARSVAVAVIAASLVGAGSAAAEAAPSPATSVSSQQSSAPSPVISVDAIKAQGYTDADIQKAIQGNPNIGIEYGALPPKPGQVTTQGVTFGKFIYVRISKAQAKAINQASGAAAVGIIGGLTGGAGALIAGVVYAYVVSMGNSALDRCANWQFDMTYPLPGVPSRIFSAKCI